MSVCLSVCLSVFHCPFLNPPPLCCSFSLSAGRAAGTVLNAALWLCSARRAAPKRRATVCTVKMAGVQWVEEGGISNDSWPGPNRVGIMTHALAPFARQPNCTGALICCWMTWQTSPWTPHAQASTCASSSRGLLQMAACRPSTLQAAPTARAATRPVFSATRARFCLRRTLPCTCARSGGCIQSTTTWPWPSSTSQRCFRSCLCHLTLMQHADASTTSTPHISCMRCVHACCRCATALCQQKKKKKVARTRTLHARTHTRIARSHARANSRLLSFATAASLACLQVVYQAVYLGMEYGERPNVLDLVCNLLHAMSTGGLCSSDQMITVCMCVCVCACVCVGGGV